MDIDIKFHSLVIFDCDVYSKQKFPVVTDGVLNLVVEFGLTRQD